MAPALHLPPPTQSASSDELKVVRTATVDGQTFASGGVIYPPPDLRPVIDKTAEFVARNGVAFEAKIKEQERLNPKFAFLNSGDAYHAYFRLQIHAAKEKRTQPSAASDDRPATPTASAAVQAALRADRSEAVPATEPERPPAHEFSLEFPSTAAIDLDVLKLAALFTARQGPAFASRLLAKEAHSHQFAFLRPQHPLFSYFHLLVEQYHQVMQPSRARLAHIRQCASRTRGPGTGGGRMHLLPQVKKRATWTLWDQERREQEHYEEERRRALFDEIDWQDFCVVGVVEVTSSDARADLPPPRSLHELQTMVETHKRMEEVRAAEAAKSRPAEPPAPVPAPAPDVPSTEAEGQHESESEAPAPPAPSLTKPTPQGPIKIRHDYQRTAKPVSSAAAAAAAAQTTVCPVCGDTVPVSDMSEHVRIELLHPKFREERAKLEQRRQEQASLAAGADPSHYLKQFAGARTDLFGARADEEAQARREADERRLAREKEKSVWDGHANSTKSAQEARVRGSTVDERLAAMRARAAAPATPLGPQAVPTKRAAEDASASSKRRTAPEATREAQYAESEWLAMYPHPITLHVQVPDAPHVAPVCDGRVLTFSGLPLRTTIGQVRDRVLSEALGRSVGASKLKMWVHGKPATLRQSLAHWNLADGAYVEMSIAK
ncbi:SF3a splicing factor complex subunit [Malassezia equina]|uniref:SF3a splicing factor complex subunit n=1 Tax=Malassezia equina TaxID=1381935 RepID=A0AAF0EGA7_9BASI|nr:SF3a splicing factor complex subunit [Malassezia equina]